jgi:putative DNA primase/helicase
MSIPPTSPKKKTCEKKNAKKRKPARAACDADAIVAPVIKIKVGETWHHITPEVLNDPDALAEVVAAVHAGSGLKKVFLDELLQFSEEHRFTALEVASQIAGALFYVGGKRQKSLLDAVLNLPFDQHDLDTYARGKTALLETAILCHPGALEVCAQRIIKRLKDAGAKSIRTQDITSECRKIQKALQRSIVAVDEERTASHVSEHFFDAPLRADAMIPAGWQVTADGQGIAKSDDESMVLSPVFIAERGVDSQRNVEMLTITWPRDGKWQTHAVDRAQIADARSIVALSAYGLPVTSNNAKHLVQFLADYEAANLEHLPVVRVTSRMGWQGMKGGDGFLCGAKLITSPGKSAGSPAVRFRGNEPGVEQLASALHSKGSLEKWIAALKGLGQYPRATLTLYASFTAPMLQILKAPNFVLDLSGPTTTGKTSALRVAASGWGAAHENPSGSVLGTWDSTAVWRERAPEILNNLPLILDETKHVRRPEDIAKTVYSVCEGRGRGRGTVQGIAHQGTWSTVMLSSGEQPLASFTEDGGTRARILPLWGSPFGDTSPKSGRFVTNLTRKLKFNYGHAGPEFVHYVLAHADQWADWRKQFQQREEHYRELAELNVVAGRMAPHLAAIYVTSVIVHQALALPWEWVDPIEPLYAELTSQSADADRSVAALQLVYEWAASQRHRFWCPHSGSQDVPYAGWAGHWQRKPAAIPGQETGWQHIGFIPQILKGLLRDANFDPASIIRQWKDRGWLLTTKEENCERTTRRMALGVERVQMVVVAREAIAAVCGLDGELDGEPDEEFDDELDDEPGTGNSGN